jgi:hypothetical protein
MLAVRRWRLEDRRSSARTIEAHHFVQGQYRNAGTLAGTVMISLPPFPDLILDPRDIWPEPLP